IWSLATIPGKRFVMPRNSRTGASSMRRDCRGGPGDPPLRTCLLDRVRDVRDRAGLDLVLHLLHLRDDRGGHLRVDLADAGTAVRDIEELVRAALERAVLDGLDRVEHAYVDLLDRAREDPRAEVRLVGVDADAPVVLRVRGVERPEAAAARDLEHDVGALRDLVQGNRLAL